MSEVESYMLVGLVENPAVFGFFTFRTNISIAAHHLPNNIYMCSYHKKHIKQFSEYSLGNQGLDTCLLPSS